MDRRRWRLPTVRVIGAMLDRNGLRPGRYLVPRTTPWSWPRRPGCWKIPAAEIKMKGRLQPGKMFLVDTVEGRIVTDREIKNRLSFRKPYAQWLKENQISLDQLPEPVRVHASDHQTILSRQRAFGYTDEDLKMVLEPMAGKGEEPVGSMGTRYPPGLSLGSSTSRSSTTSSSCFAQVTNPPIDSIREELVMSLISYIGSEGNILEETPLNCHTLKLQHPILTNRDLEKLRRVSRGDMLATTLPTLFPRRTATCGLKFALDELCRRASLSVEVGI